MKKITLSLLLLLSMLSFGQSVSVTVTELKVLNLAATTVNFAKNVTSVNVSITVSAHTSYTNTTRGSIAVYYKRNSAKATSPIIPTNGYDGNFYLTNGSNGGTGTKTFKITLSRSEFDETGGIVYLEYSPDASSLLAYKSSSINVTKLDVTPPTTTPPTTPVTNNIISGSQTISEGQSPSTLIGSLPSGGNGTFTYAWQAKTENGTWMLVGSISSSNPNYSPGVSSATQTYRRIAQSGTESSTSNEIIVTVVPAPPIQNNTITIDGANVYGSLPTGGIGNYTYLWGVFYEDGEAVRDLPFTSQNVMLSEPVFDIFLKSAYNFKLVRIVYSGGQRLFSNYIDIPHISPIQNNIISINGDQVTGTVPTGGIGEYNGDYTYLWGVFYEDGEAVRDLPFTSQNVMLSEPVFDIFLKSAYNFKLVRIAYSGDQRLFSNYVDIPHISERTSKKENTSISAVYPNPTSGAINFTTDFSSSKEIEIIVYSEELGKTQSIFKGTASPNQIVQCDIPSNYPKGIYYYKIVSENKEVKTGKIIFQ